MGANNECNQLIVMDMCCYIFVTVVDERDALRCNAIEISLYLFMYMVHRTSFSARASNYVLKAFPVLWGAGKSCCLTTP